MALFGRKKETVQKNTQTERPTKADSAVSQHRDLSSVLIAPRVTEKSARQNDRGMYTFIVRRDATKYDVRDAVQQLFKVTPRKITTVNVAPRTTHSRSRGRKVAVPGRKHANVFLKKGDSIDLI
ncbi:MAG: 50S ribosomal protein L23 [Patescibacteria group bacterium]|nr:50S ribosomal protein L23 [Patescibacteria group bacterium]